MRIARRPWLFLLIGLGKRRNEGNKENRTNEPSPAINTGCGLVSIGHHQAISNQFLPERVPTFALAFGIQDNNSRDCLDE